MPLVELIRQSAMAAGAVAMNALSTCLGEDGGLQCCAVDSDKWAVGGYLKGRLILAAAYVVGFGVTYLITSKATKIEQVPGKQFKAVEKLNEKLEHVDGVDVDVLHGPQ